MALAKSDGSRVSTRVSTMDARDLGEDLQTKIREFILKKFPLARKQQVQNSDALLERGMLDSQGVLEVVTFIEEQFTIVVADEDLSPENFQTIDRIAAFIRSKTDCQA